MTFLYPGFLWALLALSIPLIIHLFNFRKTQKIYFSNTRFIQQVQEATSSKRRLKHWLILASRLLFIFFLVLIFAQPIIPAREQIKAGTNVAIYVDNSQSMSTPVAGAARAFDASLSVARTIVENFPSETRYRLLTNDFEPFANSLKTKNEVIEQLSQVRLSGRSRTANEIKSRLSRLGDEGEIFWLSDFQRSTFGEPLERDSLQSFHLVPFSLSAVSNILIDTAYLDNPFAIGGERNTLTVRLFNDGEEERAQLTVRLAIDGLQAGTTTTTIPANAFSTIHFDIAANAKGVQRAVLSFTDLPVTFDNEFYGILNFAERIRILEIKAANEITAVEKVFSNKSLFDFSSVVSKNIDYSRIARADLVVLTEVALLDGSLTQTLQTYLSTGGSLFLIPSADPDVNSYKTLVPILVKSKQAQPLVLAKPDLRNPFFENVFQEQTTQVAMPSVRTSLAWGIDRQAILKQQDDTPYLSLFETQGKVYVLGGPLQTSFGAFFSHALFVPVMYRMAAFSKQNQQQFYTSLTQQLVSFRGDSVQANQLVILSGKSQLTPSQRINNNQVVLDLSGLEIEQGHYAAHVGADTLAWLAFNQSKAESRLAVFTESEMVQAFGANKTDVYTVDPESSASMATAIKENYQGISLWKYALILALFFILAEVLLLRFLK